MASKKTFVVNGKTLDHLHLDDLPKRIIRKGSDTEMYRDDVLRTLLTLQYTYGKLLNCAQICYLNIDSITNTKPYMASAREVYDSVQEFVYHYENYGMRIFILREKISLFINAVLPVDWPVNDVNIKTMLNHSTVKKAKLDTMMRKFDPQSENALGDLVKNRNQLTHKLYYAKTDHYLRPITSIDNEDADMTDWYKQWKKKIKEKEDVISNAANELMELNHELSEKVFVFREAQSAA